MLVNKIVLILIILFIFVVILEYLKRDIFEGMGAIIGPVISPKVNIVDKPTNTYYENKC